MDMDVSPDEKNIKIAEERKDEANAFFKNQEYDKAIYYYTLAIELNPNVAAYYGNRSFAYLKNEWFGYALDDATTALKIDKSYVKGYYRRASAYMSLGRYKLAFKDYEAVANVRPNDLDAKRKHIQCGKLIKMLQFQAAIAVESSKKISIVDSINLKTMEVEDSYTGPRLENGEVSKDFMEELLIHFKDQKLLHKQYAYKILLDAKIYLESQPSLVDITIEDSDKFTVCGDVHGQFYDLLNIFELNGVPSKTNPYLFNGDFVDRGSFSVECIFTMLGFKILYPDHFFMARGNHESLSMNKMYGFEGEVKSKYSLTMAELFTEVFNCLPLCHCINKRILVMHGGLFSNDDVTLDDIRNIDRNVQPPEDGIMCELLWSDPMPKNGRNPSKRGVGIQFGPDVTDNFLKKNQLDYIIRSHEVKAEGYETAHEGKCITVFSAPNYCDSMGNKGAFITLIGASQPIFTTYMAVPHPSIKPMAYATDLMSLLTLT